MSGMNLTPQISNSASTTRSVDEIADIVFATTSGSVVAVGGATHEQVRLALENADCDKDQRFALFVPLGPATTAEQIVEQVADVLAETVLRMWPVWFSGVDFGDCRDDTLGREAAKIAVRAVAAETTVLRPWAEAAVACALRGDKPRVKSVAAAAEIEQLCLAINRAGLVLILDTQTAPTPAAALVHALEWISQNARAAVVALFSKLPDSAPPFDRILHGAICVTAESDPLAPEPPADQSAARRPWLVPVQGIPHPLSETEQRLARALSRDEELALLFSFNQFVETIRGGRPKVDLVWTAGRLVVELDGYADHGTRSAFMRDRHRDYELTLSGYTVIRLANEEITQDIEKAVEKIRDIVQLCRARME
jgi:very-short-patch-repair endonuclease